MGSWRTSESGPADTPTSKLAGAIGLSNPLFSGDWCDVYMMTDIAVAPTVYRRISKIVLVAALSREVKLLAEQALGKRVRSIGTTAFTQRGSSMKYRGLFDEHSKKDGSINYIAQSGKWSLQEGLTWWKQKHGKFQRPDASARDKSRKALLA